MSTPIKRKRLKETIYSKLIMLEKNGENMTSYLLELLSKFKGKNKVNRTSRKFKKPSKGNRLQHVNVNNIAPKKHKKMKKNIKNKKRTSSNSQQHINIYNIPQNNAKHKKKKKKVKKQRKLSSIRDDDEYIDKSKLLSIKQWFITPNRSNHIRAKSDPSTPKDSNPLTPSTNKKKLCLLSTKSANCEFPDTVHRKKNKNKRQRDKSRNIKRNDSRKRSKVKKPVKTKKNINMNTKPKVKKRVYYTKEKRINEPKQNKKQKPKKRTMSKNGRNKVKRLDVKNKDYMKQKSGNKNRKKPKSINKKTSKKPLQHKMRSIRNKHYSGYSEEYYF